MADPALSGSVIEVGAAERKGAEMSEPFTTADLAQGEATPILGPAYFAARRASEAIMAGLEGPELKPVMDKATDKIRQALYDYVEDYIKGDLEINFQSYIQEMVGRTVQALLTGEAWALQQYPMAQYHDGEKIRAAVAKHGGEPLLMQRIADLEKEVATLTERLEWSRR